MHHNHHLITIFVIIVMIILTIIGFGVQGRSEFSGFVSDPKAHASTGGKTSKSHGRGSTGDHRGWDTMKRGGSGGLAALHHQLGLLLLRECPVSLVTFIGPTSVMSAEGEAAVATAVASAQCMPPRCS